MPHSPTTDALHADIDRPTSNLIEVEPAPKDSTVPVVGRPKISPEMLETPAAALKNTHHEKDNSSDDNNTPFFTCTRLDRNP